MKVSGGSSRRGFTIIEMMVVSAVSIVILVLLMNVFIQGLQRTEDSRLRVDMQQKAIFALNKWERDLEKTSLRAISIKTGEPFCVAMTQATNINARGSALWDDEIFCWAFKKAEGIWQREVYPSGTTTFGGSPSDTAPYVPTGAELSALTMQVSGEEKIMCDHVQDFSFEKLLSDPSSTSEKPFLLTLNLERSLSTSERKAKFTISRRYTLRNNF